jgi:hypothetical protein
MHGNPALSLVYKKVSIKSAPPPLPPEWVTFCLSVSLWAKISPPYNNHIKHKGVFVVSWIFHNVLQTDEYFCYQFFFLMTRQQFTESKYNLKKKQKNLKGSRLFCTDKMAEGNTKYDKIHNIYLRGWQIYCNLLKYIVYLGSASFDNDFSGLQYTPSPSQIDVIYICHIMILPDATIDNKVI